jgi:small ligand-binding sensory domain FIST
MSTNQDLDKAVEEVLSQIAAEGKPYKLAIFYVSTIYEASSQKYDTIFNQLKKSVPGCKFVLGTTTGAVIGPTTPFGEPVELEGRAGFSLTLGNFDDDVRLSTFSLDKAAVYNYIRNPQQRVRQSTLTDTCSVLVFTTEQVKPYLSDFLNQLESREGGAAFGAIASGVTSLHQPKVFVMNSDDDDDSDSPEAEAAAAGYTRYTAGAVGLVLEGNVEVKTVVARSCLPVGPVYEVREREGKDILSLVPVGGSGSADDDNSKLSPLEALDYVIKTIPHDHADALKRELLVGAVPDIDLKEGERVEDLIFFGQKPLTFDPISGSLTLSSVPGGAEADKLLFRFCIRDVDTACDDIESACKRERALLSQRQGSVQACVLLGSMERGNKMFRQNGWEASKLYDSLQQTQTKVPISGMFAQGAFGKVAVGLPGTAAQYREVQSLVEADSLHAFFMKRQDSTTSAGTNIGTEAEAEEVGGGSNSNNNSGNNNNGGRDVCSAFELVKFADDADLVIVEKRDPESAAPVRVATMDYVIPEKSPQPSNVLESIVWDREQAVDRMRERFQMTKALMQATRSELKYPVRALSGALTRTNDNGGGASADGSLTLVLEFNRATLHNGKIVDGSMGDSDVSRLAAAKAQVETFSSSVESLLSNEDSMVSKGVRVAATGAHLDAGTFRGSYVFCSCSSFFSCS